MMSTESSDCSTATTRLEILPTEIWVACWTLCSRRQIRRLSVVCTVFRNICLPLLFEHQTIEVGEARYGPKKENWVERIYGFHRAAVRLDALANSSRIDLVCSWRFGASDCLGPPPDWSVQLSVLFPCTYARLLNTFSATLSLYRNLRSLHFETLIIDVPFRRSLSELSRLENLTLCSCEILERNGFAMKLRSFVISTKRLTDPAAPKVTREPLQIVSPEFLHTLNLGDPDETTALFAAFSHAEFPHLVVLSIVHVWDLSGFLVFLTQCPRIEVLAITTIHPDVILSLPRFTLSPDTIPVLRDLTVCWEMLGLFSFNRPIAAATGLNNPQPHWRHSTAFNDDFTWALKDLLKASAPLLSLSIPETTPTPELFTAIMSFSPQLRQLSIHIPESRFSTWLGPVPGSPLHPSPRRCPPFRDADVFNNIPEDDLSDAEQDEPPSVVLVQVLQKLSSPSTKLHQVFHRIFDGTASLPPQIEVLRLIWEENIPFLTSEEVSVVEQQEIVAKLIVQVSSSVKDNLRDVKRSLSTSIFVGSQATAAAPAADVGDAVVSYSAPTGNFCSPYRAVLRETTDKKRYIEIWAGDVLTASKDVTERHGAFYSDEFFSALSFSPIDLAFMEEVFCAFSSTWGSRNTVLLVSAADGRVKDLTPDSDGKLYSWSMLATDGLNRLVCSRSSPTIPHEVVLGELNSLDEISWRVIQSPYIPPSLRTALSNLTSSIVPISGRGRTETVVIRPSILDATPPCVQFIHGGPHSVTTTAFYPPTAFLALEGYTVSSPNYTGSVGYGESSIRALLGNCGTLDVQDCFATVEHLIELGISVQGKGKQFLIGGSHGGFLTSHLIGQFPDLFTAAAIRNPVITTDPMSSDIPDWYFNEWNISFPMYSSPEGFPTVTAGDRSLPPRRTPAESQRIFASSAIAYVDAVRAHVVLHLGGADIRVTPTHGLEYYYALKGNAQPRQDVEMHWFEKENHSLDGVETNRIVWETSRDWFNRYRT
ncbi:Acylamino-acid-releasing enzyme [Mycena sanguinolenta]|uniref:Dipeptidyl-peptidase V n=1 Tax=Mycena sanguinolenta TaxID=230812 RepID=A0A8H7DH92_9AGAR|nr:Acylamino-acid-releasing enzyme [Mycena sanguinolenta]